MAFDHHKTAGNGQRVEIGAPDLHGIVEPAGDLVEVAADAPNGQKVRTRETLNREFAQMMAKQFRRNELFSDDETLTKVDGQILMKEIDGTRWFEFVIQLSLKDPIVMKDKEVE